MDEHRWKAGQGALKGLGFALLLFIAPSAAAQGGSDPGSVAADRSGAPLIDRWNRCIGEAAARFGIPRDWIRRLMHAESRGRTRLHGRPITSSAGAMGLMQLMPATWAELRARHRLGPDPHDPRDNILAGAAYLRAMYDRFGYPGLFAAYNAGPARYAEHLATGRRLPPETVAYVAAVGSAPPRTAAIFLNLPPNTGLFVSRAKGRAAAIKAAVSPGADALFVPLHTASAEGE